MDDIIDRLGEIRLLRPSPDYRVVLDDARVEIERLRASQFRWISVGERFPLPRDTTKNGDILVLWEGCVQRRNWQNLSDITHWAPIPPLPEKSQADRDDEMLRAWIKSLGAEHTDRENSLRIGYLEGLKAAREQKA